VKFDILSGPEYDSPIFLWRVNPVLFNPRGLPWTVGLGFGWTVLLAILSGGTLLIAWGVYLAYWVRTRQGHSTALWCYLLGIGAVMLTLAPRTLSGIYIDIVGFAGLILLVITPLVLRAEIRAVYKNSHGVNLPINPLLTILFSSAYLNWHMLDLPIPAADSETAHVRSASR